MGESYFHWLTEHAEQSREKKEIDPYEVQKKFGWRILAKLEKKRNWV